MSLNCVACLHMAFNEKLCAIVKNFVLAKIKPKSFLGVPLEDRCSESKINARLWIKQKRMLMCGAENNETTSSMADILSNLIIASSVVLSMH